MKTTEHTEGTEMEPYIFDATGFNLFFDSDLNDLFLKLCETPGAFDGFVAHVLVTPQSLIRMAGFVCWFNHDGIQIGNYRIIPHVQMGKPATTP